VRYDELSEKQSDRRYLIGARIMKINESDRRSLSQYMHEAKRGKTLSLSLAREVK